MPRTLAQNAQYIAETIKPAIKSAIEAQGVTVPSTDSFLDYADRIGEIEGGGSGYQLKDLPTGAISTVTDAAPLPLNALKVSVEAWQEGTGDPSPSNIRPIHGWDSGEIGVVGKNWLNAQDVTIAGGYIFNVDTVLPTGTYTLSFDSTGNSGSYQITIKNANNQNIAIEVRGLTAGKNEVTFTISELSAKAILYTNNSNTETYSNFQIEIGETAMPYTPYVNGNQFTQQFPQTIYGAEWDVVSGELGLKITDGFEVFDGSDDEGWALSSSVGLRVDTGKLRSIIKKVQGSAVADIECNSFVAKASASTYAGNIGISVDGSGCLAVSDGSGSMTVEGWKSWLAEHPLQVKYELATPTYITLTGLSIRLLEGTNNLYADCGEVIEGEYFVDEGAIDVRKVDYQIGASGSIKTTDGRVLSGFASMSGYHARPLDASGNWLDVDWSKDFEIGVAFKLTSLPTYQFLFGCGLTTNDRFKQPRLFYDNSTQTVELNISTDGSSWESITLTNNSIVANKWYFVKIKFTLSTLKLTASISEDLSTFATMCDETLSGAIYHNSASLSISGDTNNSAMTSNDCLIDTFNTYIKGDGVSWGAFTGVFPS